MFKTTLKQQKTIFIWRFWATTGLRKNYTDDNDNNNNNNNTNNTTNNNNNNNINNNNNNNKVQIKTGTPYSNILNLYLFLDPPEGTNKNYDLVIWGKTPQQQNHRYYLYKNYHIENNNEKNNNTYIIFLLIKLYS